MEAVVKPKRKYVKKKGAVLGRPKKAPSSPLAAQQKPTAMLVLGTNPDVLGRAEGIILSILNSAADSKTKVAAFKALESLCKVENVSISNCSFTS